MPISSVTTGTLTILIRPRRHTFATTLDAPAPTSLSADVITSATTCASTIVRISRSVASPSTKTGSRIDTSPTTGGDARDVSSGSTSPRTTLNAPGARGRVSPSARRGAATDLEVGEQRHSLAHATNQPTTRQHKVPHLAGIMIAPCAARFCTLDRLSPHGYCHGYGTARCAGMCTFPQHSSPSMPSLSLAMSLREPLYIGHQDQHTTNERLGASRRFCPCRFHVECLPTVLADSVDFPRLSFSHWSPTPPLHPKTPTPALQITVPIRG